MTAKHLVSKSDLTVLSSYDSLLPDEADRLLATTNVNDSESIKRAIGLHIAPIIEGLERQRAGVRDRVMYSLWYYLHHQPWDPVDVFSESPTVIPEPDDFMNYYRCAWETLFGGREARCRPRPLNSLKLNTNERSTTGEFVITLV